MNALTVMHTIIGLQIIGAMFAVKGVTVVIIDCNVNFYKVRIVCTTKCRFEQFEKIGSKKISRTAFSHSYVTLMLF